MSFFSSFRFTGWLIVSMLLLFSCNSNPEVPTITANDKEAIEKLARDLPLILSEQGWSAYEEKFAQDYTNWSMASDQSRTREEYLTLVKDWYDKGNRASGSTLKTIDFVPLNGGEVLYLYALQERFNDPNDSTNTLIRDIRFVGIYRKETGSWKNTFTAFMDLPERK